MHRAFAHLVALSAFAWGGPDAVDAQERSREPHTYFREHAKLTDKEIRDIENGKAFAKIVDTGEKPEVVIFGAVYIKAPMKSFVDKYRDVESLAEMDNYLAVGRFSDPAQASDLSSYTLDEDDFKALKKCKTGNCDVQLPARSIEEFKAGIDWSSPSAADQTNALARQAIANLIDEYRKGGNAALGVYQDKDYDLAVAETFETVLSRIEGLTSYLPELGTYLLDYPNATLDDTEDLFYWEKIKFGLKPTVRANHLIIHRASGFDNETYALVNKQLYASHYFQVAIDIWVCVKDSAATGDEGFYLITVKGSRQHGLTGFKGSVLRKIAVPRARGSMEEGLETLKQQLEAQAN